MNKGEWGKINLGFKLIHGINVPSQKGNDGEYYDTIFAEKELIIWSRGYARK